MKIRSMSHIGKYHEGTSGSNEDAVCMGQNSRLCVLSLADGMTACREAKTGADIASRAITRLLLNEGRYFLTLDSSRLADLIFTHIFYKIKSYAEDAGSSVEEFSSTITSVLIDKKSGKMLCYHLGDNMVLAVGNGKCRVLCSPAYGEDGCLATTTENGQRSVSVSRFDIRDYESIVIVSDGAWRNMLSGNRIRQDVAAMLAIGDYDALEAFLVSMNCRDDYSFISADMRETRRQCA